MITKTNESRDRLKLSLQALFYKEADEVFTAQLQNRVDAFCKPQSEGEEIDRISAVNELITVLEWCSVDDEDFKPEYNKHTFIEMFVYSLMEAYSNYQRCKGKAWDDKQTDTPLAKSSIKKNRSNFFKEIWSFLKQGGFFLLGTALVAVVIMLQGEYEPSDLVTVIFIPLFGLCFDTWRKDAERKEAILSKQEKDKADKLARAEKKRNYFETWVRHSSRYNRLELAMRKFNVSQKTEEDFNQFVEKTFSILERNLDQFEQNMSGNGLVPAPDAGKAGKP